MKTATSDHTLREAVQRELEWDPRIDASHIGVTAKEGSVSLSGTVPSYRQKYEAVRASERVYGVQSVADDIAVKLPSAGRRSDSEISEEIARQRRWNTLIPDAVEADVRDGHVTLHGEVEWGYQRSDAERAIRHLVGVRGVNNNVIVKPHVPPKPADIEQRVNDAIERLADLDARSIWVSTESDGKVKLHGHVHSMAERRFAEHAAQAAPGVRAVEDDLVVVA